MSGEQIEAWQIAEAVLFSSPKPVGEEILGRYLPGRNLQEVMAELEKRLGGHGIRLAKLDDKWYLRTTEALAPFLALKRDKRVQLSNSALETLAAIAYLQPITRSEIEAARGRKLSATILATLMKLNWIAPKGRRHGPGRAATWGTTDAFLQHFSLPSLEALPRGDDLKSLGKAAGGIFFEKTERQTKEETR